MARSRLGPLAVESKLGDFPSQSTVWRAVHVQLKRAVAVKIFSPPFGGTPAAREEFTQEFEKLKQLSHPAIAKCFGGGFEKTEAYLAYELLEGETLSHQLERRGRLSWEAVLEIAEPIADALVYLHEQGIVYGRLQCDKIIIAGLSPVLVDVRANHVNTPFRTGRPPTAAELALQPPEVIADPSMVSKSADLYSFGAVLYLALTGRAPISGETVEDVVQRSKSESPCPAASLAMDCPVWLDKLVSHLLQRSPNARPHSASAVRMALAEVRKRAMSKSGVAEHVSSGFSPLNMTDQKQRDEARQLLGRELVDVDTDSSFKLESGPWYDKALFLLASFVIVVGGIAYFAWPLNEDAMRARAETLLAQESRSALSQARISYLEPMLNRFPDGEHVSWAQEQLDRVQMVEAEHALSVKMNRNLPLKNEAERLYAEAQRYERFGDVATALDQYRSMVTLLGGDEMSDDPGYRPFVNLARRQIAKIENEGTDTDEATRIVQAKLNEADREFNSGNVVAARRIWYSIIELYGNNTNVAPLVTRAQERIAGNKSSVETSATTQP